jgi:hypothetical protein
MLSQMLGRYARVALIGQVKSPGELGTALEAIPAPGV